MTIDATYRNMGTSYDASGLYHIYVYDPQNSPNGVYGLAILFPDEGVAQVTGASNNLLYQVVATRQVQIRSGNGVTYNNIRFRMIKIMQV
jgi:hypothetical protein